MGLGRKSHEGERGKARTYILACKPWTDSHLTVPSLAPTPPVRPRCPMSSILLYQLHVAWGVAISLIYETWVQCARMRMTTRADRWSALKRVLLTSALAAPPFLLHAYVDWVEEDAAHRSVVFMLHSIATFGHATGALLCATGLPVQFGLEKRREMRTVPPRGHDLRCAPASSARALSLPGR